MSVRGAMQGAGGERATRSYPQHCLGATGVTEIIITLQNPLVTLWQIQSLMGRINFISSMCPFLNTFKHNLNATLAQAIKSKPTTINTNARKDLSVWLNFLKNKEN
jgi:hypothetical protein